MPKENPIPPKNDRLRRLERVQIEKRSNHTRAGSGRVLDPLIAFRQWVNVFPYFRGVPPDNCQGLGNVWENLRRGTGSPPLAPPLVTLPNRPQPWQPNHAVSGTRARQRCIPRSLFAAVGNVWENLRRGPAHLPACPAAGDSPQPSQTTKSNPGAKYARAYARKSYSFDAYLE